LAPESDPELKPQCPGCGWFQATSALPVALVLAHSPSGRILYTRQRGWPENAWGLVAGYVEAGETAEAAAVREVREETGLAARSPRVLRTLSWRDLVLVVVSVEIDDGDLTVGSELEAAMLAEPDLALTPPEWPAYAVIAEHTGGRRSH
jgi:NAD+ diphosphatase